MRRFFPVKLGTGDDNSNDNDRKNTLRSPRALRPWMLLSLAAALALDIVVLVCAAVWAAEGFTGAGDYAWRLDVRLGFYAFTMPVATFVHTTVELACLALAGISMRPIIAVLASAIALCGWITQLSFWFYCEVSAFLMLESVPAWCPSAGLESNVGLVKPFVGLFVAVAVCVYMALWVVAAVKERRRRGGEKKKEESSGKVDRDVNRDEETEVVGGKTASA